MQDKVDRLIYKNPQGYAAWPSLLILQNGDWVIAFGEAMRRSYVIHRDPSFLNMIIRSSDGGQTWEPHPQVVGGYEYYGMDDPGLVQLRNGDLLLSSMQFLYCSADAVEREPGRRDWVRRERYPWAHHFHHTMVFRSTDDGHTWAEPVVVDISPFASGCTLRPILELSDGTLLIGCYEETVPPCPSFVVRSEDGGHTWCDATTIARDDCVQFYEPALFQAHSGKIIALLRTGEEGDCFTYQTDSYDGGHTWTTPVRTTIRGYPAHMLQLPDDRILCVYGRRWEPFGIRACTTGDEGETWDAEEELVLRGDFPDGDLGYPTSALRRDGGIATAYYGKDGEGVTSLWVTEYHLWGNAPPGY